MHTLLRIALIMIVWFFLPNEWDTYRESRTRMVEEIIDMGITDSLVVEAMETVQRHLFVPENLRGRAYDNNPLPIGEGQTISQPYMVAWMTQELRIDSTDRVLEIGTGSGYQAAILSGLIDTVFTIEIKSKLASQAKKRLQSLGYQNIQAKCADGYFGWPEKSPFDAIIITCAVNHVPPSLLDQLKDGGRMILPLGSTLYYQTLIRLTKRANKVDVEYLGMVAFVPMTGEAEKS